MCPCAQPDGLLKDADGLNLDDLRSVDGRVQQQKAAFQRPHTFGRDLEVTGGHDCDHRASSISPTFHLHLVVVTTASGLSGPEGVTLQLQDSMSCLYW